MLPYKSEVQPYCRSCGRAIKKKSIFVALYGAEEATDIDRMGNEYFRVLRIKGAWPQTQEECQRLVNETGMGTVTTIRYKKGEGEKIKSVYVWDGKTYEDRYFCSRECAARLGVACAHDGHALAPYHAKMKRK